jgi:hypothetical protein
MTVELKEQFLESAVRGRCSIENVYKVKKLEGKEKKKGSAEIKYTDLGRGKHSKKLGELRMRFIAF